MEAVFVSEGFTLGSLYLPPFELHSGEYLSINFTSAHDFQEENRLIEILTGREKKTGLVIPDSVKFASPDFTQPFFERLFNSINAFDLLKRETDLSTNDIISILDLIGIDSTVKVSALGFNERIMLASEIACTKTKNIIVDCSGMDYSGMSKLSERVVSWLRSGWIVIELNYVNSRGRDYLITAENYSKIKVIDVMQSEL